MNQPILLVVTEINPGLNAFLSKNDLTTEIPLGVSRGTPGNSSVSRKEAENSPVQKPFYPKRAPIQPNRGPYSR